MKFKPMPAVSFFRFTPRFNAHQRVHFTSFVKRFRATHAHASPNGGSSTGSSAPGGGGGNNFLLPGATVATILMLGTLHARRMYEDRKLEDAREKGVDLEFKPDVKATLLRLLPLRSMSRCWGVVTSLEIPVGLRPFVYRAWARAFHSNLEEPALPLEDYASLRDFFVRSLKEGSRPINPDPECLVSPVDGTVLRFGEIRGGGSMIEQVKGFSYSVSSLLGTPMVATKNEEKENTQMGDASKKDNKKSWWRVSLTSPKLLNPTQGSPMKGLFYCVIYLKPGDYHRIHSPVDWNVLLRSHFSGRLFPVNERATRTIRNLYVENERVVLQGQWEEGFMALAAIGATNIGSIELFIEPELRTNQRKKNLMYSDPPDKRVYEPEGTGVTLKKGDEVAAFNMGSTVVLVFQAPVSDSSDDKDSSSSDFRFCVRSGDRIRVGEALGRWNRDSQLRT